MLPRTCEGMHPYSDPGGSNTGQCVHIAADAANRGPREPGGGRALQAWGRGWAHWTTQSHLRQWGACRGCWAWVAWGRPAGATALGPPGPRLAQGGPGVGADAVAGWHIPAGARGSAGPGAGAMQGQSPKVAGALWGRGGPRQGVVLGTTAGQHTLALGPAPQDTRRCGQGAHVAVTAQALWGPVIPRPSQGPCSQATCPLVPTLLSTWDSSSPRPGVDDSVSCALLREPQLV